MKYSLLGIVALMGFPQAYAQDFKDYVTLTVKEFEDLRNATNKQNSINAAIKKSKDTQIVKNTQIVKKNCLQ